MVLGFVNQNHRSNDSILNLGIIKIARRRNMQKEIKAGSFKVDAQTYFYCIKALRDKDYAYFLQEGEDESN